MINARHAPRGAAGLCLATAVLATLWGQPPNGSSVCAVRFSNQITVERVETAYGIAPGGTQGSFRTGQSADLLLSAIDFNRSGGGLQFRYNSGIASDGTRLLLADRGGNRVLLWNRPPEGNTAPDLVLGQPDFESNESGSGSHQMNWPLAVATDGRRVVVADAFNDRLLVWREFPTVSGTPADYAISVQWPWGVWTDGEKLVASATGSSSVLVWKRFPENGQAAPDLRLRASGAMGTPRSITSDGNYLIVGDHNAKVTRLGQGNFVWKTFPQTEDAPYDYFFSDPYNEGVAWLQGKPMSDGRLVMLGGMLHFWNSLPFAAGQRPDLSISGFPWLGGDASDVAVAADKIYVSGANGNRVLVYNHPPDSPDRAPDFALGSPGICTNTLQSSFFITNPAPSSNGASLFVTSDFDRTLSVWKRLPNESGARPDLVFHLPDAPWQNSLFDHTLVAAGRTSLYVWNELPLDGQQPDVQLRDRIGRVRFQEIRGVAYDGRWLFVADRQANRVYVWEGIPEAGSDPKFEIDASGPGRLSSDGTWLLVAPAEGPAIQAFRIDEITGGAPLPRRIGGNGQFNLPGHALLAGGRVFVADTVNNRIHVWNSLEAALQNQAAAAIIGSPDRRPSNRRDGLFWPGALSFDGSYLWAGEFKFSGRIARFSPQPGEAPPPGN